MVKIVIDKIILKNEKKKKKKEKEKRISVSSIKRILSNRLKYKNIQNT